MNRAATASPGGRSAAALVAALVLSVVLPLTGLVVGPGVASASPERADPRAVAAPVPDASAAALRPAIGDERRIVGILEVRVAGVPDEIKESFQHRLDEQLDSKHYWLASRARMKQLMMRSTTWTEGCLVGPCIREVRTHTGADLVLLASLTGEGTSFGYVVTLVRTDTGRVLQQHSQRCDVCTVNEALDKATQATIALLGSVPTRLPDETAERTASLDLAVGKVKQELAAHDRRVARIGTALTAVGLAALVGGVVLYQLDDQASYALAAAAGGAALSASGIVVLVF